MNFCAIVVPIGGAVPGGPNYTEEELKDMAGRGGFILPDGTVVPIPPYQEHADFPELLEDPEVVRVSGFGHERGVDYQVLTSRQIKVLEEIIGHDKKTTIITNESMDFSPYETNRWAEIKHVGDLRNFLKGNHKGFLRFEFDDIDFADIEVSEEAMKRLRIITDPNYVHPSHWIDMAQKDQVLGKLMENLQVPEFVENLERQGLMTPQFEELRNMVTNQSLTQFALDDDIGQNQLEPRPQALDPHVVIKEDMKRLLSELEDLQGFIDRGDDPALVPEWKLALERGVRQLENMKADMNRTTADLQQNGFSYITLDEAIASEDAERFVGGNFGEDLMADVFEWFGEGDLIRVAEAFGVSSMIDQLTGGKGASMPTRGLPASTVRNPATGPVKDKTALRRAMPDMEQWIQQNFFGNQLLDRTPFTPIQLDPEQGLKIFGQPIARPTGTRFGLPISQPQPTRSEFPLKQGKGTLASRPIRDPLSEAPNILQEIGDIMYRGGQTPFLPIIWPEGPTAAEVMTPIETGILSFLTGGMASGPVSDALRRIGFGVIRR